ncbi:hypothetical protein QU481_10865 [Crenobacter sp. SG2303]|uniref:Uncharacterized protein n=1 Tax=Crenobacter oryzisoli TaxID=3056844 RepID=A0ABT7XNM6_9NEIS|nr:hypothetical protein [Crenobacter sp. SG2303]MDN0075392.1 hypothetical protein [Crenobacter sp. SG2303]
MRHTLLSTAALLLVAGFSNANPSIQGSLTPPPGQGYAIVSLTARAIVPDNGTLEVHWYGLDNGSSGIARANFVTDTLYSDQGMAPTEGKVILLTLAPGRYQISDAWTRWGEDTGDSTTHVKHYGVNAPFEVKAGETVYLGNIMADLSFLPELQLRDEQQRDLDHIRNTWHVADTSFIRAELLRSGSSDMSH